MIFTASCASPLGGIVLAADEIGLTGLWFTGAKYFGAGLPASCFQSLKLQRFIVWPMIFARNLHCNRKNI